MKANQLAGILTLTAGLATQVTFPSVALAKSAQSESSFPRDFNLKSGQLRMKQADGSYIMGKIRVSVTQEKYTPDDASELDAEMFGSVFFISDDDKFWTGLAAGDDGNVLFDLFNKGESNTYEIYGCSSTMRSCSGNSLQIDFKGPEVTLFVGWNSGLEFSVWSDVKQDWIQVSYISLKKM